MTCFVNELKLPPEQLAKKNPPQRGFRHIYEKLINFGFSITLSVV